MYNGTSLIQTLPFPHWLLGQLNIWISESLSLYTIIIGSKTCVRTSEAPLYMTVYKYYIICRVKYVHQEKNIVTLLGSPTMMKCTKIWTLNFYITGEHTHVWWQKICSQHLFDEKGCGSTFIDFFTLRPTLRYDSDVNEVFEKIEHKFE